MHIHLEKGDSHAIEAYSDKKIQINSVTYERSLIVSSKEIITDLSLDNLSQLNNHYQLFIDMKPELIIIGHAHLDQLPPMEFISQLSSLRIGVEFMSIGAACRTYNVLLSEDRHVVGGFIL